LWSDAERDMLSPGFATRASMPEVVSGRVPLRGTLRAPPAADRDARCKDIDGFGFARR
jgi:hypothetical protein